MSAPVLAWAQRAPVSPLDRLNAAIRSITTSVNAKWGIYVKCLETGEEVAVNATDQMDTMSTIKIPLMIEVYRQIEAGKFSLVIASSSVKKINVPALA